MHDIQLIDNDTIELLPASTLRVRSGVDDVIIDDTASGRVDVDPNEYYLTSAGMYTGRLTGTIPTWLQNAIQQELTVGEGNLTNIVNDITNLVNTLQVGVEQNATQIHSTNVDLAALETSVVSRLNGNDAAILSVETTRVTTDEAQTIALDLQRSTFGYDAEAYITSLAATYTDENSAVAQDIDLLVATVGDVTASVTQTSVVSVEDGLAHAKNSLIVNADGNISGYVAESGATSSFEILADTFKVSNGTTKLPVFTVDTTPGDEHVAINSNVRIDGNLIVDGTVTVNELAINSVTVNKIPLAELTQADTIHNVTSPYSSGVNIYSSLFYAEANSRIAIFGALHPGGTHSPGTTITYSAALQYSTDAGATWNELAGNIGIINSTTVGFISSVISVDFYTSANTYFRIRHQVANAGVTSLALKFIYVKNRR